MNRIDSHARSAPSPLGPVLRFWLLAGLALCVLVPPLRGSSYWLGWLPLWLVVIPLVGALLVARDPWCEARAFGRLILNDCRAGSPVQARRIRRRAA